MPRYNSRTKIIRENRWVTERADFGGASNREASVCRLDPATGDLMRIAPVNPAAVPVGAVDPRPNDIGNWESSSGADVTEFFPSAPGTVPLVNVAAHSLHDEL